MIIEFDYKLEYRNNDYEFATYYWDVPYDIEDEITAVCVAEEYGIEPDNFIKLWNDLCLGVTETFVVWKDENEIKIKHRIKELYPDIALESFKKDNKIDESIIIYEET